MIIQKYKLFSNTHYFILLSTVCALGFAVLLYHNYFLYIQYDAYYYAAVADSLIHHQELKNIAHEPAIAVMTPQNGIVYLHFLLHKIGIHSIEARLTTLLFANAIIMIGCCTLLFRVFQNYEIERKAVFLVSLSACLSYYFYMVLLQPINDGLFILLNLIALNIILKNNFSKSNLISLLVIALVIGHFRLSGFLVFAVAAIAYLTLRHYRQSLYHVFFTFVSLFSPFILAFIIGLDFSGFGEQTQDMVSRYSFEYFVDHAHKTLSLNIPEAFFRMSFFTSGFSIPAAMFGYLISIPLISVVSWLTYKAIRNRNLSLLVICGVFISYLLYFQVHKAQPTRYIILLSFLFPYLLLLVIPKSRQVRWSTIYLAIIAIISTSAIFITDKGEIGKQKFTYKEEMLDDIADKEFILFSHFPRITYYLLDSSAHVNFDSIKQNHLKQNVLIVGPREYIGSILYKIQNTHRRKVVSYKTLPNRYTEYLFSKEPRFEFKYDAHEIISLWLVLGKGQRPPMVEKMEN